MRDWVFWAITGAGFIMLGSVYSVVKDIQGRLIVLYEQVQTLRNNIPEKWHD